MPDPAAPQTSIILYQTEDGRTRIRCRFENETIWLTQKLMAELFQKDVRTINEHIQNVFTEAELAEESVIRKFRITAADGRRTHSLYRQGLGLYWYGCLPTMRDAWFEPLFAAFHQIVKDHPYISWFFAQLGPQPAEAK